MGSDIYYLIRSNEADQCKAKSDKWEREIDRERGGGEASEISYIFLLSIYRIKSKQNSSMRSLV